MKPAKSDVYTSIIPVCKKFLGMLAVSYFRPLYHYVVEHPSLIKSVPGFLLSPEKLIIYVGRTHFAIEYIGPEYLEELHHNGHFNVQFYDYSTIDCNLFEKILGFEYDSTLDFAMPLPSFSENLLYPTNKGWDKLIELGWNTEAQSSIMAFNTPTPEPLPGQFSRVVNGTFFDADESGLKTRRIKWLDFFPILFDGSDKEIDAIRFRLDYMKDKVEQDAHYQYPIPESYKYNQLPKINRFIEKWGDKNSSEPDITSFLSQPENQFILTMKFGAMGLHSELLCEWQSENKKAIKPDFFVVQPNGYADIVEFKLPEISKKAIVGKVNRESFGAWLASYISQTRVYSNYFDDPNNRKWFEDKYGFKVHKPRRWLVVGRRHNFRSDDWREILLDYKDLEILTFDDIVDGVVAQFYRE